MCVEEGAVVGKKDTMYMYIPKTSLNGQTSPL